ncbi:MAG: glycosyltransferase [Candidatus Lambdaproteobacteria bacterium]|nr:glycosyltransferase [Candidatus Lambdaproteobacteria bacterium]
MLFVSHTAHLGGAEIVLQRFLRRVKGFEYLILIPAGPFSESLAAAGVPYLLSRSLGNLHRDANVLWPFAFVYRFVLAQFELLYWLRCLRPSVVQCNNYVSVVYTLLPALLLRTPIVWHMHDFVRPNRATRWLLRSMSTPVSKIIAVSDAVRGSLLDLGIPPDKVVTVYNAADPPAQREASGPEARKFEAFASAFDLVLGVMGTISHLKGIHEILEALRLLVSEHGCNAGVMVAGQAATSTDRHYLQELQELVVRHGLEQRVRFLGQIADTDAFYRHLDALVHYPVKPDSLPTVILEAIQSGCPVVAARIGGVPECLGEGRWGELVAPHDPRALARTLATGTRKRLGPDELAAFRRRFSHEAKEARHLEIYRGILH